MSYVTLKAKDGSGDFRAYIAKPTNTPSAAIVVIQEIFGVNKVMRDICDHYAEMGYLTICPDLFWRQEPEVDITDQTQEEWDKAFELFGGFDVDKGVEDLQTTASFIRSHEACNGKVGSIGFCLGGKLAFLMASRTNTDCNVSYYGVGLNELVDEKSTIKKPLLMHVAAEDKFVDKDAQKVMEDELMDQAAITYHKYEGVNHAFARVGGEHYDEKAATLANQRTKEFFEEYLK